MADGYARVTGRVGVVSVHQGPGLTNTMTGLAEAAKSRTPVLVLAGETPAAALTSNFRIDQHDLVESVGRDRRPRPQREDRRRRRRTRLSARGNRAPSGRADAADRHPAAAGRPDRAVPARRSRRLDPPEPAAEAIAAAADLLGQAQRPAIIAGRGAVLADAGPELERPRRDDRRGPGDVRARERPVRRAPVCARDLGRVRQPVRGASSSPRPTSCSCSARRSTTGRPSTAR